MSDLIRRNELLKAMDTWDKFGYDEHNRLIRIDSTNKEYVPYVRYEDMVKCVMNMPIAYDVEKAVEKLGEYEDLEKQGLLLRLPCNVGDIVYSIAYNGKIYPVKATREVRIVDGVLHIICESWRYSDLVSCDDIGKTVFLTQTEAEQKVKELIKEKKIKMYNLD